MKKATIKDVPDWFWSAGIYQKELSLAEWAEELDARLYLMHLSLDEEFDLGGLEKPNAEWNEKFIDFTIRSNRDEWHYERSQLPPITLMGCKQVNRATPDAWICCHHQGWDSSFIYHGKHELQ